MNFKQNITCCCLLLFSMVSCTGKHKTGPEGGEIAEVPIVSYAKRFKITHVEGYSQVQVFDPWQSATDVVQRWFLVPRGQEPPEGVDSAEIIQVPVRSVVCMSTTHLAMISALDESGSVKGFSGTRFICEKDIGERVRNGLIHEIGYEDNLNKELILKLKPDLVMVYGIGGESSGYTGKLKELGIKVFFNADYLETDPLGKAEWIKLIGALYCKDLKADTIFRNIVQKYTQLRIFIKETANYRPDVLLGAPFKDTWYISPGNSYISRLIQDAGGKYLWQETESSAALPVSLETVYLKALKASYWLNTGSANSKRDIVAIDPRLADLESFRKGNLFNNNRRMCTEGGNDYWESGSLKPHVILKDIAAILHPELFPDEELYYYKKLN